MDFCRSPGDRRASGVHLPSEGRGAGEAGPDRVRFADLYRAVVAAQRCECMEDLLEHALSTAVDLLGAQAAGVWLGREGEPARCVASRGAPPPSRRPETGNGASAVPDLVEQLRARLSTKPLLLSPALPAPSTGTQAGPPPPGDVPPLLVLPLTAGGATQGALQLFFPEGYHPAEEKVDLAQGFADAVAAALSHIRARQRLVDALEAVEAQHAHLQAVFDSFPDALILTDAQGSPRLWNAVAGRRARGPLAVEGGPEAAIDHHGLRHLDGSPLLPDELPAGRALRGESGSGCLLLLRDAGGRDVRVECAFAPVPAPDGGVAGAVIALRDVSRDAARAEQLEAHRRMLQAALDGVVGPVVVYDAGTGRPVVANSRAARSVLSPGQGLAAQAGTARACWAHVEVQVRDVIRSGTARAGHEWACREPSGSVSFWDWRVLPLADSAGRVTHVWAGAQDVTQRVQQRECLAVERALEDAVFRNAPVGLLVCHPETLACVRANDAAEAILGAEAATGRPLTHVLPVGWGSTVAGAFGLVARTGEPFAARAMQFTLGPHQVWLDLDVVPISGPEGDVAHLLVLIRDVTQHMDAQRRLQDALQEVEADRARLDALSARLQDANTAKDRFLAVLSHELRNPLAPIQAGVEVIRLAGPQGDVRVQRALDTIARNVKLQARLINDLLDVSRIARGKVELRKAPVSLGAVVEDAARAVAETARAAGVTLEVDAPAGIWVSADADRLQQMVLNLLGNAVKFAPEGTVRVSAARCLGDGGSGRGGEGETGELRVQDAGHEGARIVVEDTGIGISPEVLPRLFEMFWQGQGGDPTQPGLGVGLAVVKLLAEMHGGRAWAESAGLGQGSRFTIELPLLAREEPATPAPQPMGGSQAAAEEYRLFLVEDNPDVRELLAEGLSLMGYAVESAETAEDALRRLDRANTEGSPLPDVLLSDIGLPGMDGLELMRRVRRLPGADRLVAFATTGLGAEEDVLRAREAGFDGHLTKPVDVAGLDQRIRRALRR